MHTQQKFGACSWIFGEMSLGEIAQRLMNLRFDGVELMGDLSRYSAAEASRILGDFGLSIFSLTPDNVDLAHPDTAVRQQAIDYYLQLLDFASELGQPLVSCHGFVGRVAPISTMAEERELLVTAVFHIAQRAQQQNLRLVFEVLNRYETHLIHTSAEALKFIQDVDMPNLGILLDAYHMNIEEQNSAEAIRAAGDKLWLYHMADSNRQGIGRGHIKLGDHLWALEDIGYNGPIIFECTAPGPNPFTPIKDDDSLMWLETYLRESRDMF
ncbi:4Fe-4S ferredoxin, iron-sulfur binding [hydrothermal vent metagenome]|uniref:4Fe-4S ferredoxin, iron-sulfur binding n=1 Tax=hydrothermal vent metagenome TaxID=652676 RepID=A0A3B0ULT6_9ZZZZ